MSKNREVVSLIRKFQNLFSQLDHQQIAERLLKQVIAQPFVSRCSLLLQRDGQLWVEASASQVEVTSIAAVITEQHNLCDQLIDLAFSAAEVVGREFESPADDIRSVVIQPIGEGPIAAYYIESSLPLALLRTKLNSLRAVWQFSELLLMQYAQQSGASSAPPSLPGLNQRLFYETYLKAILKQSPTIITIKNMNGEIILASDHIAQILAASDSDVVGKTVLDIHDAEAKQRILEADEAVRQRQENVEIQIDLEHKDGSIHTYWLLKFALQDADNRMFGVGTIATDITDQKNAETILKEQEARMTMISFQDELTGLPNRALFYDRINHSLVRARRSGNQVVLMLLDLDRFKHVNDSLSHDAGDELLKIIARRLQENLRDMDTVARLGGDEFVVVLEGVQADDDVALIANKILKGVAAPATIMGHEIATSVSVGISLYPADGETTDTLLQHAEVAMYKAKAAGKNCFRFFTEDMNTSAVSYLLLENELRRAIETDQLMLHYQPQFDLDSGEIAGMEALVRWHHPERGLMSPYHFISIAEESGLIVELGYWVLSRACQQIKQWVDSGKYFGSVAVNLSPRQFSEQNFTARLADVLTATGLPPHHLELEITESCAMENANLSITMMKEINAMGVSLSIDDFGTGYSSLAYLKEFPIQKLKIDRSFVNDINTDNNDAAIAQSIISLSHNMSLKVVAEGVEHEAQAVWLRERGCDMVQGYHFAKPMSAEKLSSHLQRGKYVVSANLVTLGTGQTVLPKINTRGLS